MKICARLLACLALLPAAASANLLAEIYALAIQSDPAFAAARANYEAAIEIRPQLRARALPQLGFSASLARQQQKTGETNTPALEEGVTVRGDIISANLQLTQPIFDWSIISSLRQIDERVGIAELNLHAAQQDLLIRVVSTYFDWLAAEDSLRFAKAEKSAIQQQLEQANNRFEVGLSAITDVQEAQARYDLALAEEIEAASQLRSAREAMTEITGEGFATPVPLRTPVGATPPEPANPDSWVERALRDNLDLQAAELSRAVAEATVRERIGGHLPTLNLDASYAFRDDTDLQFGRELDTTSIALRLDIPLFSGLATSSQVRQSRSELDRSHAQLEQTRRSILRQARDSYDGVTTGVSRVRALRQAVKSTETALEAVQAGFSVGSRTSVDVLNAQRELYRSQRDLSRARYNYLLSLLRLKQLVGALADEDLRQVDGMLVTAIAN